VASGDAHTGIKSRSMFMCRSKLVAFRDLRHIAGLVKGRYLTRCTVQFGKFDSIVRERGVENILPDD